MPVEIRIQDIVLDGHLVVPDRSSGLVLFAHGSGSSRHSPRNRAVAQHLNDHAIATLLFDLLTEKEGQIDARTRELRFDIDLLAERLNGAAKWVVQQPDAQGLKLGYFGASTGAAAALTAAGRYQQEVQAIVSRGGRPDLARTDLSQIEAPTLLIVGERDSSVIGMNQDALDQLRCEKELSIVPNATHLFEEPGALDDVAQRATDWFSRHFVTTETRN